MFGTVAITDHGWYEYLAGQPDLDEVNFWTPSAHWTFRADVGAPFFFKLKAQYGHAICGFASFARFVRIPDWLAWDSFGPKNGCPSLQSMRERIGKIRNRIDYHTPRPTEEIGCILLVEPHFFPPDQWVTGPSDWPATNLRPMRYDLAAGEGRRIWTECLARVGADTDMHPEIPSLIAQPRFGAPQLVRPRLGQGTFRIAVTEAYARACAITGEHSLPALEAAHIRPFASDGPHDVRNGLLLRADLHRLFDMGYMTVTPDHRVEVSDRLRLDYQNGRSYYPLHGTELRKPLPADEPDLDLLRWHNDHVFLAA